MSKLKRTSGQVARPARKQARRALLSLELLEDRIVPAVDTLATAATLTLPTSQMVHVGGFIEAGNDVKLYALRALTAGDVLHIDVDAAALGSGLDSYLRIFNSAGAELFFNDNFDGSDSRLTFQVAAGGDYYIGISSAGNSTYNPQSSVPLSTADLLTQTHGLFDLTVTRQTTVAAKADLVGASFNAVADTAVSGDTITVNYRVDNRGGAAAGDFTINFYETVGNTFGSGTPVHTVNVTGGLAANSFKTGQFTCTLTGTPSVFGPGFFIGMVIAPPSGGELNTANNANTARGSDWDQLKALEGAAINSGSGTQVVPYQLNIFNSRTAALTISAGEQVYFEVDTSLFSAYGLIEWRVTDSGVDTSLELLDGNFNQYVQSAAVPGSDSNVIRQHIIPGAPGARYFLRVTGLLGNGAFVLETLYEDPANEPPGTEILLDESPKVIASGDFNGDGVRDVAMASSASNTLTVNLGLKDGFFNFGTDTTHLNSSLITGLTVADFNNDGRADLAVTDDGNNLTIYLSRGDGSFQQTLLANYPRQVFAAAGDFNNDGKTDLVAGVVASGPSTLGRLYSYRGDGLGGFTALDLNTADASRDWLDVTGLSNDWNIHQLSVGDFNEDGRLDVTSSASRTFLLVAGDAPMLLGQGDGTFALGNRRLAAKGHPEGGMNVVRDFNGDGHLDIIESTYSYIFAGGNLIQGHFFVYLGDGQGNFGAQQQLFTRVLATTLDAGDLNSDGVFDLVLNDLVQGQVSVLLGTGAGLSFEPEQLYVAEGNVSGNTVVGDFNTDGRADVLVGGENSVVLNLLLGRGDGSLVARSRVAISAPAKSMVAVDLNADGRADLATANLDKKDVAVLLSNGDGTFDFSSYQAGPIVSRVVQGDFNGDGRPDLAGYHHVTGVPSGSSTPVKNGRIDFFLGVGDGSLQFAMELDVFANSLQGPVYLLASDLNCDGRSDIVVNKEVYLFGPNMTVTSAVDLPNNGRFVGFLNGDNIPDLLIENGSNHDVYLGQGNGAFTQVTGPFASVIGGEVQFGDFNNDGKTDIYVLAGSFVHIYRGDGTGNFVAQPAPQSLLVPGSALAVGDFDNDGNDDFVVVSSMGTIVAALGKGDGSFVVGPTLGIDVGTGSVTAFTSADVDGDGRLDLALTISTTPADGQVLVLLGLGNGLFVDPTDEPGRATRDTPLVADLNGDGIFDIVSLTDDGTILYRQGMGPGEFAPPIAVNLSTPARDVAILSDSLGVRLAATNLASDQVTVYTFAAGSFTQTAGPQTGVLPSRIAADDLNGDGRDDLVVVNAGSNDLSVFLGTPAGGFSLTTTLSPGNGPRGLTLADFDGDGDLDVVVANESSGDVSVFFNQFDNPVNGPFTSDSVFRAGSGQFGIGTFGTSLTALPTLRVTAKQGTAEVVVGNFTSLAGDAIMDVVAINNQANTFALLAGHTDTTLTNPLVYASGTLPTTIVSGDFNGDGLLDFAMLNAAASTISVYLGNGLGGFTLSATVNAGNSPTGLTAFDINSDNALDLLVGNEFGDVLIILGNGDGTFRPFVRVNQGVPFVTTDTNGDGVADVVLANQSVDQVLSQIRNAGTTTFNLGSFSQTSAQGVQAPGFLTLADINNDNRQDLLVANSGSNNVLVYLGTGPGQFSSTSMSFFAGTNPVSLAVLDLDNDGRRDVAVANQGSNDVTVLKGSGSGTTWTLTPGPRLAVGVGPNHIEAGFFNNDAVLDLMVTNAQQAEMWVLSGTGGGFFNDVTPAVLAMPGPINQTILNNGLGFVLLNTGSIFTFNPFDFSLGTSNVYNSPAGIQTNSFTFRPGTTDIFTGRGDGSIAVLTASNGQYADSLVFNDARLTNPSALQVVGDDIYVTNQGNSMPVVIGFENIFGSGVIGGIGDDLGGSVTNLDSIDAARLSVIATTLASSSNTDDDDDDETDDDEAGDAFVGNNVGLIGSVNLLALLFAQQSGVEDETATEAEGEAEVETPEWVEFVVGLQEALERFRADLRANNPDLPGIELVDDSLAQLGLWMADSARGLDGWLTALAPPPREFETALLASRHPGDTALPGPTGGAETAITEAPAAAAAPAALGWWGPLQLDWWSALTAATITACAWLGWRRRRRSPREEAAALRPQI